MKIPEKAKEVIGGIVVALVFVIVATVFGTVGYLLGWAVAYSDVTEDYYWDLANLEKKRERAEAIQIDLPSCPEGTKYLGTQSKIDGSEAKILCTKI